MPDEQDQDREFYSDQVLRMGGMPFFPKRGPAIRELVNVLQARSKNRTHAEAAITRAIMAGGECPAPADLAMHIGNTTSGEGPDPECPKCLGSSIERVQVGETFGARRCSCVSRKAHTSRQDAAGRIEGDGGVGSHPEIDPTAS